MTQGDDREEATQVDAVRRQPDPDLARRRTTPSGRRRGATPPGPRFRARAGTGSSRRGWRRRSPSGAPCRRRCTRSCAGRAPASGTRSARWRRHRPRPPRARPARSRASSLGRERIKTRASAPIESAISAPVHTSAPRQPWRPISQVMTWTITKPPAPDETVAIPSARPRRRRNQRDTTVVFARPPASMAPSAIGPTSAPAISQSDEVDAIEVHADGDQDPAGRHHGRRRQPIEDAPRDRRPERAPDHEEAQPLIHRRARESELLLHGHDEELEGVVRRADDQHRAGEGRREHPPAGIDRVARLARGAPSSTSSPAAPNASERRPSMPQTRLAGPCRVCHADRMKYEVVSAEVPLGEGPVWCPDGSLVVTTISPGRLLRIDPKSGRFSVRSPRSWAARIARTSRATAASS